MTLCFVLEYLEFLHIVEGALYPARTRALYDRRLCQGCDLSASWPCPLGVLPVMSVSLWFQFLCRLHQLSWNQVKNKLACLRGLWWREIDKKCSNLYWKGCIDQFWFVRLPLESSHPWLVGWLQVSNTEASIRSQTWTAGSLWPTLSEPCLRFSNHIYINYCNAHYILKHEKTTLT